MPEKKTTFCVWNNKQLNHPSMKMAGSGMAPLWDHPRGGGGKKRRDNLLFPSLLFCRVGNEGLPRTEKFKDTSRANQKHSSSSPLLLLRQQQRRSCRKGCFFFVGPILRCTSPFNDSSSPSVAAGDEMQFFPFSLRCKIEASSFYELHFFGTTKKEERGKNQAPNIRKTAAPVFLSFSSLLPLLFLKALFLHAVGTVLLGTLEGV